jgi:ParB family chromosome partitioning protein
MGRAAAPVPGGGDQVLQLELDRLHPNPSQPRREFPESELQELADSIRSSGILQPILVRAAGDRFEIVAGERRWRAAKVAGLTKVPVLVKQVSDEESAVFALVENVQRTDLNAIEKAAAFQQILDRFSVSQEELARKVGIDRTSVTNFVRLLGLPKEIQDHVSRGTLSMGHARALLGLVSQETQVQVAEDAIRRSLSVREIEETVRELSLGAGTSGASRTAAKGKRNRSRPAWLNELEETLCENLGTPVSIRYGKKRSEIVIQCSGREVFERVYARLKEC